MLLLNVYYRCKSGQREAFHKELSALGARAVSIQEAGNGKYDYFFDAQDPTSCCWWSTGRARLIWTPIVPRKLLPSCRR